MNQKNCIYKIYSQENTGDGVIFSAVWHVGSRIVQNWTPSQMLSYENWELLQNINFTKQCCATTSDFLWHFHCITSLISDKSVSHSMEI